MTEEEFMQKSEDALKRLTEMDATMDIIRARLAQPEPVIQARKEGDLIVVDLPRVPIGGGGISAALLPQREWIDLTPTDIKLLRRAATNDRQFAELLQAKLKEKNT